MLDWLTSPQAWIALGTLTALEIVLGIDNIIFISILVGRLPEQTPPGSAAVAFFPQQARAKDTAAPEASRSTVSRVWLRRWYRCGSSVRCLALSFRCLG